MDRSKPTPTLLAPSAGVSGPGQRILASLEHGGALPPAVQRPTARQLDRAIIGASMLALVLALFA